MRLLTFCLCIFGLTIAASGQVTAPPTPEAELQSSGQMAIEGGAPLGSNSRTVLHAQRAIIRLGDAVLTADEADVTVAVPGQPSDFELRGNVRLKAVMKVANAR